MTIDSPFSQNRFEYEGKHSYYLPESVFTQLESPKPTYLIGSRGTGKTTLLKALCWDEQTSNESLKSQLRATFMERRYIGTYVKLPTTQLGVLDSWLHASLDPLYGQIFSFYLEVIGLQLIVEAMAELRASRTVAFDVAIEREAVTQWYKHSCVPLAGGDNTLSPTLVAFASHLASVRNAIERSALRRDDPLTVSEQFGIKQIAMTTSPLLKQIAAFWNAANESLDSPWHFKVCMDEGECLTERQHLALRTAFRLADWPLFPIASFVRLPHDRTTTAVESLTLQEADRRQIILDGMTKADFKAFAEGVATIRCREWARNSTLTVDVYSVLGKLDLNRILQDICSTSERPRVKTLLENARALSRIEIIADDEDAGSDIVSADDEKEASPRESGSASLPIWQAYVLEQLQLKYPHNATRKEKRHFESINLRKKSVAAYLAICKELNTAPKYASADMVLEISDNCIRDFLAQMDFLFRDSGRELVEFLSRPLSHEIQYRALVQASNAKRDSLPRSGVQSPVQTRRLVEGLALITASLQIADFDNQNLSQSEQGRFVVEVSQSQIIRHQEVLDLLCDAAESGFLRLLSDNVAQNRFRVHTSLAPAFGFSYRGAYYDTWLAVDDLERLRNEPTADGLKKQAQTIASRVSKAQPRPLLDKETP